MSLPRLRRPQVTMVRHPQSGTGLTKEQKELMRRANAISKQTGQARSAIGGQASYNNKNSFDQILKDTKILSSVGGAGLGILGGMYGGPMGAAAAGSIGKYALAQTGYGVRKRRRVARKTTKKKPATKKKPVKKRVRKAKK